MVTLGGPVHACYLLPMLEWGGRDVSLLQPTTEVTYLLLDMFYLPLSALLGIDVYLVVIGRDGKLWRERYVIWVNKSS